MLHTLLVRVGLRKSKEQLLLELKDASVDAKVKVRAQRINRERTMRQRRADAVAALIRNDMPTAIVHAQGLVNAMQKLLELDRMLLWIENNCMDVQDMESNEMIEDVMDIMHAIDVRCEDAGSFQARMNAFAAGRHRAKQHQGIATAQLSAQMPSLDIQQVLEQLKAEVAAQTQQQFVAVPTAAPIVGASKNESEQPTTAASAVSTAADDLDTRLKRLMQSVQISTMSTSSSSSST